MKSTVLTGILLVATGAVSYGQLSFLPQVGFERSGTTLNYNSLSASQCDASFRANLRADYRFKGGHGPYIGLGTSPAQTSFSFNNTGALMEGMQTVKNNLQFRLEGGYQYTSKAIQLKRNTATPKAESSSYTTTETVTKKSCGSSTYRSSCGSKKRSPESRLANNSLNMRLQPSLGLAYLPSAGDNIQQTANGVTYTPGWKTAIVPAMGFEFARGNQRFLTLSVFYTRPFGQQEQSFTDGAGTKALTTTLQPRTSTWGMAVGVPFSFAKSNANKTKTTKAKKECNKTYYKRCIRIQQ